MLSLTSFGAAGEVTGSRHLLNINGKKVLLDCGMFQGPEERVGDKNENLGFDPNEIDAVVLSHGHLDHCGSLPTLFLQGYKGKVYCSSATRDVAKLIMSDSADIQEEDAAWKNKHWRDGVKHEPIYTKDDVESITSNFEVLSLHTKTKILPDITLELFEAGHILGSTLVHLTIQDEGKIIRLGYTGDLGQLNMPILNPPETLPETDILISESTYGNRLHEPVKEREQKLIQCINEIKQTSGKIIIPSFALGRLQTLVYTLHKLELDKQIPEIPIYIDSPLGTEITDVFESYPELYDEETRKLFSDKNIDPFGFKNLNYVATVEQSKELNSMSGPMIIISSSGMAEAGRVIHHLKHNLENPKNIVLIVGYMADETLGRKILDGEKQVEILHDTIKVKAKIEHIDAFSAHADQAELVSFIKNTPAVKKVILVHGDEVARKGLHKVLSKELSVKVDTPVISSTINLD